ncbi:efflux RND transporter periplasmic adaptor subunit [Mucilaginibacter sp.]|uniref:efflux RND transporter periplasmic adaptor subunit n=1 Tax=Mucilaginibacter sp. TaxID=1882438 RepID=UPI000CA93E38|nr:efflux RND transporter periplasmic adaptor subunit [Mucilaginibacter sp.]PLW89967.1 MAG: efflux RND transporter periplasmic adaptor subunit [Mucilaginibacter sp.]PMP65761.1 MAG: efflux RND transporter periplasmic adaptor subunit [Mucilaginibacter sp.]
MKKQIIYMGLVTLGLTACHEKKTGTMETKQVCISDSLAKMVEIDTAKSTPMQDELTLSGEVSFDENKVVKIFPTTSGQVMEVKVSLGDRVVKGQTLAVLRSADVAGNYTDLDATRSDLSIAKRQLDQAEYLFKNGISSERDYTEAKENYNKATAANRKIKQQIAINGCGNTSASGTLVIKSPGNGFIVEKNVSAGNFIRPDNNNSLFTISDMKDVWIWANVFETDIAKVKKGYDAKITTLAYPDKVFNGKIDEVSSVLDPDNKVMKVRIALNNSDMLLKPEMFTNVIVTNKEATTSVAVPASAVIFDNSKNFVVLYNSKCDLQVREVNVIKTVDNVTYIASGLKPGDKVVSKSQLLLYNALTQE